MASENMSVVDSVPQDRVVAILTDSYLDYRKAFIDQVSEILTSAGYGTVCISGRELEPVSNFHQTYDVCNGIYQLVSEANLCGVICISGAVGSNVSADKVVELLDQCSLPIVSLGLELPGVQSVVFDDGIGMRQLMEHLLADNTRSRYAFVRGSSKDPYSARREAVFCETLASHGHDLSLCFFVEGNYDTVETYHRVGDLLAMEQVDVIVAANDQMALSAAKAVNSANLKIPQDILVTGFDDTLDATKNAPAITTVRQPISVAAKLAVQSLLDAIDSIPELLAPETRVVDSEFLIRGSTLSSSSLTELHVDRNRQWLVSELKTLMSGLSSPAGCNIERVANALWETLETGSPAFHACIGELLELPAQRFDVHWWSNLRFQIETQAMKIFQSNRANAYMPMISASLALVQEKIWSVSMNREFEIQRLQSVQAGMQSQMCSCTQLEDILATMGRWLDALGARRCFLVRYTEPVEGICDSAELVHIFRHGQIENTGAEKFATRLLLPEDLQQELSSGLLVLNPIYAGKKQYGYLLLDPEGLDRIDIDSTAHSIGNAMRNQYLINKLESQTSNLQAANSDLTLLANHDVLTGLPNRLQFQQRLNDSCEEAKKTGQEVHLLFIDLDGFKMINDSLGHGAGDLLLQIVAKRLTNVIDHHCAEKGLLARLGGDEFTVLLHSIDDSEVVSELAQSMLETITSPYSLEGNNVSISASIGCACFPEHGSTSRAVLKSADTAMYSAKEMGKNCIVFYTPELSKADELDLLIDQDMRVALENGSIRMHFQPRIDLETGKVIAVEALMRWIESTPSGDVVRQRPDVFIPIAERTGFINQLDRFALEESCRLAKYWEKAGESVCISVNLSVIKLRQHDFLEGVERILNKYEVNPALIEFEVTESAMMSNVEKNIAKLSRLRDLGFRLAIDDFGTGHSSLNYLKRLPVNTLKIDRSFIKDISSSDGGQSADSAIVRAISVLAKSMNFELVAEGIETFEQVQFVKSLGCEQAQGFYFSKPLPVEAVTEMLSEQHQQDSAA